tara:strand:+ start:8153 stop:9940 length:1788 start_codon:yes stop_codon:yes gene_type:complete
MKLSKIYSNQPHRFTPIFFNDGLNVVLGEIRMKENLDRDTHNLGKSTLGKLIDFCLLKGRNPKFFLFEHLELFEEFEFFLEVELETGRFLTIKRAVATASKVSFKRHDPRSSLFDSDSVDWDHEDLSFERAKQMLDSLLGWDFIKPWKFRNVIGYLLRSQEDYQDVFQLGKFSGKHSNWKPFLAQLVGFDGSAVQEHYAKEAELAQRISEENLLKRELGTSDLNESEIDGILFLKQQEAENKRSLVDAFDFREQDQVETTNVVEDVELEIAQLNQRRYTLQHNLQKIEAALSKDATLFDTESARILFQEAGILFEGQIKRDFDQLIDFNRAITDERRNYLEDERAELLEEVKAISERLDSLGLLRSNRLKHLSETKSFERYKQFSSDLVVLQADIASLERMKDALVRLNNLAVSIDALKDEEKRLESIVRAEVRGKSQSRDSRFSQIRLHFSNIVEAVIDRKALLSVSVNKEGHLEFSAHVLDESGNASSAGAGHTYLKLLCIAFDLAFVRAYLDRKFPQFVFHDGVFESLDDRKKENLIEVIRQYSALGIQAIITLIDSDLPVEPSSPMFDDREIVLRLHDEGESGRLFKMPSW